MIQNPKIMAHPCLLFDTRIVHPTTNVDCKIVCQMERRCCLERSSMELKDPGIEQRERFTCKLKDDS